MKIIFLLIFFVSTTFSQSVYWNMLINQNPEGGSSPAPERENLLDPNWIDMTNSSYFAAFNAATITGALSFTNASGWFGGVHTYGAPMTNGVIYDFEIDFAAMSMGADAPPLYQLCVFTLPAWWVYTPIADLTTGHNEVTYTCSGQVNFLIRVTGSSAQTVTLTKFAMYLH